MQCALVGFVSRGLITLTEGKNKESAEENNSKLTIQKDIKSTSNKSKLLSSYLRLHRFAGIGFQMYPRMSSCRSGSWNAHRRLSPIMLGLRVPSCWV